MTIVGFPVANTAGNTGTVTVTAYDAYDNVATGYAGTVVFTSSDPHAELPPRYTFADAAAGQHSFPLSLLTAGTQSITATDTLTPNLTATESNIVVAPAAASILSVTGFSTSDIAGAPGDVSVTAYDPFGNVATSYAGAVSFTSSDPRAVLPPSVNFEGASGTVVVGVTLVTAGTRSITATDTLTPRITGAQTDITVLPGAAATLAIVGPPTPVTAGVANSVTVTAHDAYGNVATGYSGTVAWSSSDAHAVLPSSYTFANSNQGTHTFSVVLETAGPQSLTATDDALASLAITDPTISVQPAAAHSLVLTGLPASVLTGTSDPLTVTAYDAYGNVATGYTGTISFKSSDAGAVLPEAFSFDSAAAGTRTFGVTFETVGNQTITAADTVNADIKGTTPSIAVRAIPQIEWSSPVSIVFGTPLSGTQLDASANVAGTFTYTPAAGAILDAGSDQTLQVVFTPSDAVDYLTATATTTISVTKAVPSLKVTDGGGQYRGRSFPASITITGVDGTPASSLDDMTPAITYYDGPTAAGTSSGSTPPSSPGIYTAVAAFDGDANYSAARSSPVTFTIGKGAASLTVTPSVGSSVFGQSDSFTVQVGAVAGTPTGTVSLADGATPLGTVALDAAGAATFVTSALSIGSHAITATYSGDADLLGVPSDASLVTVTQTGTGVVVSQTSVFKKKKLVSVLVTAHVEPSAPGGGVPTGELTFELIKKSKKKQTVTRLGVAGLVGGEATMNFAASKVLHKAITIVYSGDANDRATTLSALQMK